MRRRECHALSERFLAAVGTFPGCCWGCLRPLSGAWRRGHVARRGVHEVCFFALDVQVSAREIVFWRLCVFRFPLLAEPSPPCLGSSSARRVRLLCGSRKALARAAAGAFRAPAGAFCRALTARAGQGGGRFPLRIVRGGAGRGRGKCEGKTKKNGKTFGRSAEKA